MMRTKILRFVMAAVMAVATIVGVTFTTAAPSQAQSMSYVYRYNPNNSVWVSPSFNGSNGMLVKSGRSFWMICWKDGPWTNFYGNYWTNRYFYGIVYTSVGNYYVWVTASDVGNQQSVRAC